MVTADFLVELNQRLQTRDSLSDPHGARRADARGDARPTRSGSCRDSGWLLVETLRQLGLAARFVSGYLMQLAPDTALARRPERHRSRLHRPARVVRGVSAGRGLDRPRSDLGPARGRRAHSGRLHAGAGQRRADLRRGRRVARSSSNTSCRSQRVLETPRVTKPYTEEVWCDVLEMGAQVDQRLDRAWTCA